MFVNRTQYLGITRGGRDTWAGWGVTQDMCDHLRAASRTQRRKYFILQKAQQSTTSCYLQPLNKSQPMSLRQFSIAKNLPDQSDIWQRVDICPVCVSRVVAAIMTPRGNAITRPAAERLARTIAPDRINTNTSATGCIQKCERERGILMQSVHNFRPQNTL